MSAPEKGYSIRTGYSLNGSCAVDLDEGQIVEAMRSNQGVLWVHIRSFDMEKTFALLTQRFGFSPLEAEDALSAMERPALKEDTETLFLVATWPYRNDKIEFVEIGFFVGRNYIVTVASNDAPILDEWSQRWCRNSSAIGRSPAYLLHSLLDAIVDDYFPIVDALEDQVDALEDRIYRGRSNIVTEALRTKRNLLHVRRQITPVRDVLNGLMRRDVEMIPLEVKPHFQDVFDHTIRIAESLDITRDILGSVIDAHLSLTSNKLNEVMRFMTVISTILMSMAVISGIYGMNFRHMPELDWRLGYGFALGLMALVALIEYIIFRKKGWLTTRGIERSFRVRDAKEREQKR